MSFKNSNYQIVRIIYDIIQLLYNTCLSELDSHRLKIRPAVYIRCKILSLLGLENLYQKALVATIDRKDLTSFKVYR